MRDGHNIRQVEQLGIDWMGFIFYPPSPRFVKERPSYMPSKRIKRIGVFVNADWDFMVDHIDAYALDFVQLHGNESPSLCRELKRQTGKGIIKAFGIRDCTDLEQTADYGDAADFFLFDNQCETAGGSGKAFNHDILTQYQGNKPFLLSGGLGPENISEIKSLNHHLLYGIDLNSRFETSPALKSVNRLQHFIHEYTKAETL